jgi:hypothetical protein
MLEGLMLSKVCSLHWRLLVLHTSYWLTYSLEILRLLLYLDTSLEILRLLLLLLLLSSLRVTCNLEVLLLLLHVWCISSVSGAHATFRSPQALWLSRVVWLLKLGLTLG